MEISEIRSQLEEAGYFTRVVSGTLIVGTNLQVVQELEGGGVFNAFCSVELHENVIVVEYGQANRSEEEKFSTAQEAVDFIKKRFSLKE